MLLFNVLQLERYHYVIIETQIINKQGVLLVELVYFDIVITEISVHEAQKLVALCSINKLINLR